MGSGDDTPAGSTAPVSPPPVSPPPRRTWSTVLMCLLIFGAGGVVGGGVTLMTMAKKARHALHHPEELPRRIAHRLKRKLDLDDQQTERVMAVFQQRQQRLLEIRETMLGQAGPQLDEIDHEVAAILTPAQQQLWSEGFADMRVEWMPGRRRMRR